MSDDDLVDVRLPRWVKHATGVAIGAVAAVVISVADFEWRSVAVGFAWCTLGSLVYSVCEALEAGR